MKITIFVSYTFPYIGNGIGNIAIEQGEKLADLGHEVTIVSSNFPKTKKEFIKNKVKHIKLSAIYILEKINVPVPLYLFNYKIIKLIKLSDVIHVHDAIYPSSFLAALIGKFFNKPIILTQHIPFVVYPNILINIIQKFAYLTFGKIAFLLSDKIIIYNPEVKKMINSDEKVCFIPNGVDLSLFYPDKGNDKMFYRKKYDLPIDKKIVLFVGRLVPKKGYKLLFGARDNRYLILFVGNGKVPEYMGIAKNVRVLPAMKQEELSEIYRLSNIFALPSHSEGFPLAIQEAMACGLPVITTKCNIFDKSIDFIKTIDLNTKSIKKATLELINDNNLITKMGLDSREFAVKNYSWHKNVSALEEIYKIL
ncbi:MAG TPA: glycosyltransferase family 4 protein [Candidatus Paceibacterota bacterium]|nr:glycosyltransferase family 4 protein [Candidatus Paceibacterota bacterium]